MGRTTIYRTDVEKARNTLIKRGINPSLDALRIELGNTGSKSTIHKFLREIEADEAASADAEPTKAVENAIGTLVAKLAAQLHEEANARIADARSACEARVAEGANALAKEHAEVLQLAGAVDRLEATLDDERATHADSRNQLQNATVTIGQLEERIAGLEARLIENAQHVKSLETKHDLARQALEHFRTSAKEQREQEHQRHEHQVQGLQAEVRQAQESITAKNQDLLQLNRDNARLSEQVGQQDKELTQQRAAVRERDHELKSLRPLVAEHKALETRFTHSEARAVSLAGECAELEKALSRERDARQALEGEKVRAKTIEDVIARIHDPRRAPTESTAASKDPS